MKNCFFLLLGLICVQDKLCTQQFIYVDTLLPETYKVMGVSAVDDRVVWATASEYDLMEVDKDHLIKVLRTTDGGHTWQVFGVPEARGRLAMTIAGRGPLEAWITTNDIGGGGGKGLLKTTDGGHSWQSVLPQRAGGVLLHFFDSLRIYCQNGPHLGRSADGGQTWAIDTLDFGPNEYIPVHSGNHTAGVAGDTIWVGTSVGRILRCTDYGKNCVFLDHNRVPDSLYISSLLFTDSRHGWIFRNFSALVTQDGGVHWERLRNLPVPYDNASVLSNDILPAYWKDDKGGLTVWGIKSHGAIGSLFYTTDQGKTWMVQHIPGIPYAMACSPSGRLWVAVRKNSRRYFEKYMLQYIDYTRKWEGDGDIGYLVYAATENLQMLNLLKEKQQIKSLEQMNLPPALRQYEQQLRDSIARLETRLHGRQYDFPEPKIAGSTEMAAALEQLRSRYDSLIHYLDSAYPGFQRQRFNFSTATIEELHGQVLQPGQALLEYFNTDTAIWLVCLSNSGFKYTEIKKDFPLEQWIAELRHSLTAFHTDAGQANNYDALAAQYTTLAHRLYEKLLAPIADSLPGQLIIVPDGVLGYLPFEVLLTAPTATPTRWQEHPYLLKKHPISYAFSATMLREMTVQPHLHEPTVPFYGFAPRYDGDSTLLSALFAGADLRKDLTPLPHTGEEVYKAAKLMDGKYFTGRDASEATFRAKASEARILHLATHGQANDRAGDYCFLVFADQQDSAENEILYARDIYNLQLNAELVTLSACETGLGELQGGEGIISLARAFAYAGAKSIVTSLWSVSDAKTKDLMIDFYKNLRKGMLKDEALRQAKLDFLKRNRGQAAHPFYWAGYVGIGNMGKIK